MARPLIYCDYNAGAPLRPAALDAMTAVALEGGNASSIHGAGRRAKARLEEARDGLAELIGARAENVVFTAGATEALRLALEASGASSLILSAIEHDALWEQGPKIFAQRFTAPVTSEGVINLAVLEALLAEAPKPALVALMLANNETGAIQPVAAAAALARQAGALLLVDAAQAAGRVPVDAQALDATYLVLSSHKVGGPAGAGALVLAPGAPFRTPWFGGGQERGRRPGTENIPAIVGFAAALAEAEAQRPREAARLAALRDAFESAVCADGLFSVFAGAAPRLPNTSLVACPALRAETVVIGLDLKGFAVSSGAACSSGKVRTSRVLQAMGAPQALAGAALRASFGWASRDEDALALAGAMRALGLRAQDKSLEGAA